MGRFSNWNLTSPEGFYGRRWHSHGGGRKDKEHLRGYKILNPAFWEKKILEYRARELRVRHGAVDRTAHRCWGREEAAPTPTWSA